MTIRQDLQGEIAVVTGSARGIGRAIAAHLAAAGASVALLDRDGAADAAAEIIAAGDRAIALSADVSSVESLEAARAEIEAHLGAASILVNNAAIRGPIGRVLDLDPAGWQALLDVNLSGYFLASRCFAPGMTAAGRGALIHVGSITGTAPLPAGGAVPVAKAGVLMLSRLLALELGPQGVRSNVVNPGLIATPMTEVSYSDAAVAQARTAMVPSGRIGTPDDIAAAVGYLAGPGASYVNGAEIMVDGGLAQNLFHALPRRG